MIPQCLSNDLVEGFRKEARRRQLVNEGSDGAAQASGQWLRLAAAQSGNASGPSLFRFGAMSLFRNVPLVHSAREGLNSEQKELGFFRRILFLDTRAWITPKSRSNF